MIVSRLISGLGNQLFQYAVGRQLSLNHSTVLKLDTSFFEGQNLRSYKLDKFNINATVATDVEIASYLDIYTNKSLFYKLYRRIEARRPKNKKRVFREAEWWVYEPEVFLASSNVYLDGYWQHYKYFENLAPSILDELTLKEPYNHSVTKLEEEIVNNSSSVAVHVRRGDYITDTNAYNFMGVMPISYYKQALEYIKTRVVDPHFYFFSDDLCWVRDNLITDSSMSIVEVENGADYLDLDLMSKCAHNIIANSSFSWWGAFLNRNLNKVVVAPKQWVVQEEVNKRIEIIFPSWVKL
jgi:hypothetical protein